MLQARDSIDQEIWWEPRCGQSSLWYDNWTQLGALYYILPISNGLDNNLEEINQITLNGRWNINLLKELLNEEICHKVLKVLGNYKVSEERDFPWWMPNPKGKFTVGTAWEIMRTRKEPQEGILNIWEKGIPFKVSFLLWRVWLQRIPIGEVLVKNRITDSMIYCCCDDNASESFNHLFFSCPNAKFLWQWFAGAAGLHGPFVQLRQTIYKWWEGECVPKLRPLYKAIPAFILWQLWKRRNVIRHGGKMSQYSMIMEVNKNLSLMAKYRYPWLVGMPNYWPLIVQFLEAYTPLIHNIIVRWICPVVGSYKCNTDRSSKGNLNISTTAFCVRDDRGDLVVAQARDLGWHMGSTMGNLRRDKGYEERAGE
ncbi:hypothetical protein MTR67_017709 [Solanum verrucosum]|uniref:Reverse transcriptase zinc-binding domain-containing protein n=1 Tax=Solanum verrucosum TaxID=315347 RepID=A0AAF0TM31_SOLVR|nr:hypothetical protein MTR67_017709 [Solanum verrucosum]